MKTEARSIELFEVVFRGETLFATLDAKQADAFAYERNRELKKGYGHQRHCIFVTEFVSLEKGKRLPVMRRQAELHVA